MGGGKETPRQKMIGMMYLVLLALLAMNVSKSIIQAFVTLNNKLEASMVPIEAYNVEMTKKLEIGIQVLKGEGKDTKQAEKHLKSMQHVNDLTKEICNFLITENHELLKESVGESALNAIEDDHGPVKWLTEDENGFKHLHDLTHFTKKDDYDTPTRLFVGDHTNIVPRGKELVKKIHSYRDELCKSIANYSEGKGENVKTYSFDPSGIPVPELLSSQEERDAFSEKVLKYIDTQPVKEKDKIVLKDAIVRLTTPQVVMNHGEKYPWIAGQFDHAPVVAATTIFTSLRADILGVETLAAKLISERVDAPVFNFNKIEPLAFSTSSYINQGDSVELAVMIAAYDSTEAMNLRYWEDDTTYIGVDAKSYKPYSKVRAKDRDETNMKTYTGQAGEHIKFSGGAGDHIVVGEIEVEEGGNKIWKPWKFTYSVGSPSAAVSAADLQVLYKGWPNKIKVAAAGYNPEKVTVKCSGCKSMTSKPDKDGNYIAKVTKGKEAFITVTAIDDNGKSVELAKERFRIFKLPPPTAYFGGKAGGKMSKLDASQIPILTAGLGDSPLDVPYEVVQFSMLGMSNGNPVTLTSKSRVLTRQMKELIKRIPVNGSLTFTSVKVKGPGGVQTLETGIVLKLTR